MNNHYNQIVLSQIGKILDTGIEFLFERHLWLGLLLTIIIIVLFYKFWTRPLR